MKVKPKNGQSLLDIALQTSGSIEAAFDLAGKADLDIAADISQVEELETVGEINREVVARYTAKKIYPATDITAADMAEVPYGGIGFMGIEIDFIVS